VVVCLRVGRGARADLVQPDPELPASVTQAPGRYSPGTISATGTGADGLWLRAFLCSGTQSVQEHYGFEVGASAVRTATLKHAQRAQDQLQASYREPFRILPAVGAAQVIGEADGTMICTVEPGPRKGKRPRDWKEMRLVAAQALDSATTVYGATFGSVDETGQRWGHCARQAGWGLNSRIHVVGDGAEWIQLQCQEVFQSQGSFLCDFYHVSEYLGAAAPTCRALQPHAWRRTQQKRLRRGAVQQVTGGVGTPSGARRHRRRAGAGAQRATATSTIDWTAWTTPARSPWVCRLAQA
jgi:hypothetical protein